MRTCKRCCAPAKVPPAHVPPADFKPVCSDAETEKCNHGEWIIRNKQSPLICANHQHGWENSDRQLQDSMDITEWYPIIIDCLQQEEGDWTPANCPPADIPPGVVQKAASNMTLSYMKIDDNPEKCEQEVWINSKLYSPWVCAIHQYERQNSDMRQTDSRDVAESSPITSDCLQPEKGNCLSHAVYDDSVALKPLIQVIRALFSDDGDMTGRSGLDTDDGGSPAGLLGYLPWCLCWPRSLHRMTQCLAKIKGPSVNILTRVIMNDGGLWDVRISVTLPATCAGMEIHPTVIGLRASVGGSAASSDWLGILGPADGPPGGIWIRFIRRTVQHAQ